MLLPCKVYKIVKYQNRQDFLEILCKRAPGKQALGRCRGVSPTIIRRSELKLIYYVSR